METEIINANDVIRVTTKVANLLTDIWKADPKQGKYFLHHSEYGYINETLFWDLMDEKAKEVALPNWAGEAYILTQNKYLSPAQIAAIAADYGWESLQPRLCIKIREMNRKRLAERIRYAERVNDGKIHDDYELYM